MRCGDNVRCVNSCVEMDDKGSMQLAPVFGEADICLPGVAKVPAARNGDEVGGLVSLAMNSLGRAGSKELKSNQLSSWSNSDQENSA